MASKDNKTSKTARVMNLLSKKQDPTPAEETTEAAASASSAPVPPILNSMSPDAEVSVQIKNALEDALEEEMSPQPHPAEDDDFFVGQPQPERGLPPEEEDHMEPDDFEDDDLDLDEDDVALDEEDGPMLYEGPPPTPKAPAAQAEAPVEAPEVPHEEEVEAPVQKAPEEAPAAEEPAPPAASEPPKEVPKDSDFDKVASPAYAVEALAQLGGEVAEHWQEPLAATAIATNPGYINVMQVLVEEKAPKYIQMFGLCQCKRCLEDVKALTLNHLPPKYVVLEKGDLVPRLTLYEGKYSSDITAQLLHACRIVMETPHHDR